MLQATRILRSSCSVRVNIRYYVKAARRKWTTFIFIPLFNQILYCGLLVYIKEIGMENATQSEIKGEFAEYAKLWTSDLSVFAPVGTELNCKFFKAYCCLVKCKMCEIF